MAKRRSLLRRLGRKDREQEPQAVPNIRTARDEEYERQAQQIKERIDAMNRALRVHMLELQRDAVVWQPPPPLDWKR